MIWLAFKSHTQYIWNSSNASISWAFQHFNQSIFQNKEAEMSNSNHPLNSSNSLHYTKLKALCVANFPYKCVCTQALSQGCWAPILDVARPQASTMDPQSHAVSPDISHGMAASTLCRKHVLGVFHQDSATYLTHCMLQGNTGLPSF